MKINGKNNFKPVSEPVAFRRQDGFIAFVVESVLDTSEVEKVLVRPEAPNKILQSGQLIKNIDDPAYKKKLEQYSQSICHWIVLKSIENTEGLEFETVDMADPDTWPNYEQEMLDIGMKRDEINYLVEMALSMSITTESSVKKATEDFLAMKQAQAKQEQNEN